MNNVVAFYHLQIVYRGGMIQRLGQRNWSFRYLGTVTLDLANPYWGICQADTMTREVRMSDPARKCSLKPPLQIILRTHFHWWVLSISPKTPFIKKIHRVSCLCLSAGVRQTLGKVGLICLISLKKFTHTLKVTTWPTKLHTWIIYLVVVLTG